MRFVLLTLTWAVANTGAAQAPEPAAATLMREHKCYVCHADNDALAGPAFADIAAKFRGNPNAIALIRTIVRDGKRSGGPWHMPPHPEVSADEATAMAHYILSLDARPIESPGAAPREQRHPAAEASPRS